MIVVRLIDEHLALVERYSFQLRDHAVELRDLDLSLKHLDQFIHFFPDFHLDLQGVDSWNLLSLDCSEELAVG